MVPTEAIKVEAKMPKTKGSCVRTAMRTHAVFDFDFDAHAMARPGPVTHKEAKQTRDIVLGLASEYGPGFLTVVLAIQIIVA